MNKGPKISVNAVVGTMLKYFETCLLVFNSGTWITDSGFSEHICYNPSFLTSMTTLKIPHNINLPNSKSILLTHIESVLIPNNLILHYVLYVTSFKYNLLSIHKCNV